MTLSWRYLPTIVASSLIVPGWALVINNLGHRRYPLHWWAPGPTFVRDPVEEHDDSLREFEEGEIQREATEEGDLAVESDRFQAGSTCVWRGTRHGGVKGRSSQWIGGQK